MLLEEQRKQGHIIKLPFGESDCLWEIENSGKTTAVSGFRPLLISFMFISQEDKN